MWYHTGICKTQTYSTPLVISSKAETERSVHKDYKLQVFVRIILVKD